jgi:type VI secretion system secreted protein Hcp
MSEEEKRRAGIPSKALKIAVPTLAALGAGTAIAAGAIPSGDGTITACYLKDASDAQPKGAVRIVNDDSECNNETESSLAWNQRGPQGIQGAAGARGDRGDSGPQGAPGPQGSPGASGGSSSPSGETEEPQLFLNLDGIPGGSTDKQHKGEIAVNNYSFGLSSGGGAASGGGGAGKVKFDSFAISKKTDKASTKLFKAGTTGEHIKKASFYVVGAQDQKGNTAPLLEYDFSDVTISGLRQGSGGSTNEHVEFAFQKITITTNNADGTSSKVSWDIKANKAGRLIR